MTIPFQPNAKTSNFVMTVRAAFAQSLEAKEPVEIPALHNAPVMVIDAVSAVTHISEKTKIADRKKLVEKAADVVERAAKQFAILSKTSESPEQSNVITGAAYNHKGLMRVVQDFDREPFATVSAGAPVSYNPMRCMHA